MKERSGEHHRGDAGQLALFVIFLAVWSLDSFVVRFSTGLSQYAPLAARLAVATASLLSLLVLVVIYRFCDFIAGYEERLLEKRFGDEYRAYRTVTGKLLPRLGRRKRSARHC